MDNHKNSESPQGKAENKKNEAPPRYKVYRENPHEIILSFHDQAIEKPTKEGNKENKEKPKRRRYQITKFNIKNLNDFSMTLSLTYDGRIFIDSPQLHKDNSRNNFVKRVMDTMLLPEAMITKDLEDIIIFMEKKQREHIRNSEEQLERKAPPLIWTPSEATKIIDFMNKDHPLKILVKDMESFGYMGMDDNIKALYLACTSRLTPYPISILQIGNSAVGKSLGQKMALLLMPKADVEYVTSLSPTALSYYGKYELAYKILCVDEFVGFSELTYPYLRSFISNGMAIKAYTEVNKLTGEMQVAKKEMNGPTPIISSLTHDKDLDNETKSRMLILAILGGQLETRGVFQSMAHKYTEEHERNKTQWPKIQHRHHVYQKLLKPIEMRIPQEWATKLDFNDEKLTYRRRYAGYLAMLHAHILLTQFGRKVERITDEEGKIRHISWLTKEDIHIINALSESIYPASLDELSPVDRELLNYIIRFCKEKAKGTKLKYHEIKFTRREIMEYSHWDYSPLKRSIYRLKDLEYIQQVLGSGTSTHYYQLNVIGGNEDFLTPPKLRLWYP